MGSANETTTIERPAMAVARPGFTRSSDRPIISPSSFLRPGIGVPASALCEPTAYPGIGVPPDCAKARSQTAIGARGTHRLMVVSDRARLADAVRRGVAQAACDFPPSEDVKLIRQVCDITARFAETQN